MTPFRTALILTIVAVGLTAGLWSIFVRGTATHLFSERPMPLRRARVIIVIVTLVFVYIIVLGLLHMR
jgi:hypothetical protein